MSDTKPDTATTAPRLDALLAERFGWRRLTSGDRVFWFRGHVRGRSAEALASEAATLSRAGVEAWLRALDGHFALVLTGPDWSLAAVDRVRSSPLLWARHNSRLLVSSDGPALRAALDLGPDDLDNVQGDAFAMAGFTVGDATLYRGIRQLLPGTYLLDAPDMPGTVESYHRWRPHQPAGAEAGDLATVLSRLHESLIARLVEDAAGRPILVPLSAGLDSRFLASGLAAAGYKNVHCVAYGRAGNREAVVSEQIARRLGYRWSFVPYTNAIVRTAWASDDHRAYEAYADSFTAIPFPQDYVALTVLRERDDLPADTVVVNGQTGDFITGNHVPRSLIGHAGGTDDIRMARIVDALVAKHFKHWTGLATPERMARIRGLLSDEIAAAGGLPGDPADDFGVYEYSEFVDRQAKYVINGQRLYEYLGLDWRLPFWDRDYLDFWERAPLSAKANQALYRDVLERDNWGGVWRDIPVNPMRIRPVSLMVARQLAKILHAPLGAERWHAFERRYFLYW
ncbi:MAG: asparagine synthase C-terminal domain-containing protein, partial [Alphaproteobacteria bacterium]